MYTIYCIYVLFRTGPNPKTNIVIYYIIIDLFKPFFLFNAPKLIYPMLRISQSSLSGEKEQRWKCQVKE